MKIGFYGAARTVTGSRHLVTTSGGKFLLDCGLFQGGRKQMVRRNTTFPFSPAGVDAVLLSHAHIDHSGNLPNLAKQGFRGKVHATRATAALCQHMLMDSAKIQESDAAYWNKRRAKKGKPPIAPLYTSEDTRLALDLFVGHHYGQPFEPVPGTRVTLYPAGHILGAAVTLLEIAEGGKVTRLGFSGDLGRKDVPLLVDPRELERLDYLILESTYGDRDHPAPEAAYERLREVAARCCGSHGKLIIPAFAVGRAQDLVYNFHRMMDRGQIPRLPIYVDSPLAVNITKVFRMFRDSFDEEAKAFMHDDPHKGPLSFPQVKYISSVEESKALNEAEGPLIIISPSGMAHAGRILHHLRSNIEDPANTVLMVGYAAPNTLGRRLIEKQPTVRIFGDEFRVRARIEVINGFSAHADQEELLAFVQPLKPTLKKIFLVHGEERAAFALREALQKRGFENVSVPELDEVVEI